MTQSNVNRLIWLLLIALVLGGFFALRAFFPDCSATSQQAKMARSLSESRLAELHATISTMMARIPEKERILRRQFSGDSIPPEFVDLRPALVRLGGLGGNPIVRLEGCMDHHLDMEFYGVGEPEEHGDHSPRIVLISGEWDIKEEVLWRSSKERSEEAGTGQPATRSQSKSEGDNKPKPESEGRSR